MCVDMCVDMCRHVPQMTVCERACGVRACGMGALTGTWVRIGFSSHEDMQTKPCFSVQLKLNELGSNVGVAVGNLDCSDVPKSLHIVSFSPGHIVTSANVRVHAYTSVLCTSSQVMTSIRAQRHLSISLQTSVDMSPSVYAHLSVSIHMSIHCRPVRWCLRRAH